ncbi:MAG: polyphosphate kinase 1 [Gammaproteobacteria bacterium]|nr:polyphosphate kinase 1 [Gammaproteobacteria bacterium]
MKSKTDDLKKPELYLNRQLSLLEFNQRVLEQARDVKTPLLERLKFLCISSSNLDEFFEIRVAGLKELQAFGSVQTSADHLSHVETLRLISLRAHKLVSQQYQVLNAELIPALRDEHICLLERANWTRSQSKWVKEYFTEDVLPLLSPMVLDPAHPFPRILNKSLNFILSLEGKDVFGRNSALAILQAPRALPRIIRLPSGRSRDADFFTLLSSVIQAHVNDLFPGMKVTGCYQFRLTRNGDLFVDEEEVEDLLLALEGELVSRRYGDEVRLEIASECPSEISDYLLERFDLEEEDMYPVDGPVNLSRLMNILELVERPDLTYTPFTPGLSRSSAYGGNIFDVIRHQDLLLHHPFQSFAPVVEFIRQASTDANVLAIRQTLYRTGTDSAIVELLRQAAQNGKEVTVVIELRARFDEEANISLANRLQEAGAHVVYGVVGYKTHAKMSWVVRREQKELRHYVHVGTGNYHARTARLYTDYGLLTSHPDIADDVASVFLQLTSLGRIPKLKSLLQSPFTLSKGVIERINREVQNLKSGKPARVMIKVNGLSDPEIIRALYTASQAGVEIDLIVRGICCLRPGIPGVSENIRVRAIIGRFLEHTRVYYFENGGNPEVYCSSADLMERNLHKRIETAFPLLNPALKERVIQESFYNYLADNTQTWLLQSDGSYVHCQPKNEKPFSGQSALLEKLSDIS